MTPITYTGNTQYWWALFTVGIATVLCGFFYWLYPSAGYHVASALFGWLLIAMGATQIAVGGNPYTRRKVWWIIGGFIDAVIGFALVRNVMLAESVLPYALSIIFIYWGIASLASAFSKNRRSRWWLSLINGIMLIILGYFFIESGYVANVALTNFLVSLAFIYWGFIITLFAYDIKLSATP